MFGVISGFEEGSDKNKTTIVLVVKKPEPRSAWFRKKKKSERDLHGLTNIQHRDLHGSEKFSTAICMVLKKTEAPLASF